LIQAFIKAQNTTRLTQKQKLTQSMDSAPFLGVNTQPKWNCRSVAVLSFLGGVVASACILGAFHVAILSGGSGQQSAISLDYPTHTETWCESTSFRNVALKTVVDATIFGLVKDISAEDSSIESKFEASGVVKSKFMGKEGDAYYVICDSSWSIPVFTDLSQSGSFTNINIEHANYLIPPADLKAFPHEVDSNWEAITYNGKKEHHIVVQESLPIKDDLTPGKFKYHAIIMEVSMKHHPKPEWTLELACPSEFTFRDESKGFEGLIGMDGIDGRFFLFGLCEGNYCNTGAVGKEHGNGRMVIMELDKGEGPPNTFKDGYLVQTSTCLWKTLRVIDVPKVAFFEDYSDVARRGDVLAISSQQSSAMLFANMKGLKDGLVDPDTFEIASEGAAVTRFAPTPDCQVQYCNVEGIEWINDRLLIGSSDSMKGGGPPHGQPFLCLDKDQSMHVFALPNKINLFEGGLKTQAGVGDL